MLSPMASLAPSGVFPDTRCAAHEANRRSQRQEQTSREREAANVLLERNNFHLLPSSEWAVQLPDLPPRIRQWVRSRIHRHSRTLLPMKIVTSHLLFTGVPAAVRLVFNRMSTLTSLPDREIAKASDTP